MASGDRFDEDQLRSLLQALRDGNGLQRGEAMSALIDEIDGWLLAQFYRARIDNQDFQDLQHSTVVKILQSAHRYDNGSPVAWLKAVVRSVIVDHLRLVKVNAPAALQEGVDPAPQAIEAPVVWDAWQGKGLSAGPDPDQWSEGQRRLALERCVELHLERFEADDEKKAVAIRNTSLGQWTMRKLGEYLGKNENIARVFAQEARRKSARYLEDCMQFVQGLADRRRGKGQGEGRA